MAIFSPLWPAGRVIGAICFWTWGALGLLVLLSMFSGIGLKVTVGDSAYIAACALFWIGGMILFGIGALLAVPKYSQSGLADLTGGNSEFNQIHEGTAYRVEPDGSVIASTSNGIKKYRNWDEFWNAMK